MSKKAQAAMEFLMTYGWAILIVIAVVAALYATGVLNLGGGEVAQCSPCFPAGSAVAYIDHNADTLVVRVGPNEINDTRAIVGSTAVTQSADAAPGTDITYTSTGTFGGDVSLTLEYRDTSSGLQHNITATLHGA
jgi:hypothetical protein